MKKYIILIINLFAFTSSLDIQSVKTHWEGVHCSSGRLLESRPIQSKTWYQVAGRAFISLSYEQLDPEFSSNIFDCLYNLETYYIMNCRYRFTVNDINNVCSYVNFPNLLAKNRLIWNILTRMMMWASRFINCQCSKLSSFKLIKYDDGTMDYQPLNLVKDYLVETEITDNVYINYCNGTSIEIPRVSLINVCNTTMVTNWTNMTSDYILVNESCSQTNITQGGYFCSQHQTSYIGTFFRLFFPISDSSLGLGRWYRIDDTGFIFQIFSIFLSNIMKITPIGVSLVLDTFYWKSDQLCIYFINAYNGQVEHCFETPNLLNKIYYKDDKIKFIMWICCKDCETFFSYDRLTCVPKHITTSSSSFYVSISSTGYNENTVTPTASVSSTGYNGNTITSTGTNNDIITSSSSSITKNDNAATSSSSFSTSSSTMGVSSTGVNQNQHYLDIAIQDKCVTSSNVFPRIGSISPMFWVINDIPIDGKCTTNSIGSCLDHFTNGFWGLISVVKNNCTGFSSILKNEGTNFWLSTNLINSNGYKITCSIIDFSVLILLIVVSLIF